MSIKKAMTKAAVLPNAVVRMEAIFSKAKCDFVVLFFMLNAFFKKAFKNNRHFLFKSRLEKKMSVILAQQLM
jgi:hypothetical protein